MLSRFQAPYRPLIGPYKPVPGQALSEPLTGPLREILGIPKGNLRKSKNILEDMQGNPGKSEEIQGNSRKSKENLRESQEIPGDP